MAETPEKKVAPAVVKNDNDPVKIKCTKVSWPPQHPDPLKAVEYGELPTELKFEFGGIAYEVPVVGEMKVTMPRIGADFIIARAKRHWTLRAELSIMEPTFK